MDEAPAVNWEEEYFKSFCKKSALPSFRIQNCKVNPMFRNLVYTDVIMNISKEIEFKLHLNQLDKEKVMNLKKEYQEARDKESMTKEENKEEEKKEEQPAEVQSYNEYYGYNNSYIPIEPSGDLLEKALSSYDRQYAKRINEEVEERLKNRDNNMKRNYESKTHEEPSRQEIAKDEDEEIKEDEEDKKSEQEEYMNGYWFFEKCETESTYGQNYKNCKY